MPLSVPTSAAQGVKPPQEDPVTQRGGAQPNYQQEQSRIDRLFRRFSSRPGESGEESEMRLNRRANRKTSQGPGPTPR